MFPFPTIFPLPTIFFCNPNANIQTAFHIISPTPVLLIGFDLSHRKILLTEVLPFVGTHECVTVLKSLIANNSPHDGLLTCHEINMIFTSLSIAAKPSKFVVETIHVSLSKLEYIQIQIQIFIRPKEDKYFDIGMRLQVLNISPCSID